MNATSTITRNPYHQFCGHEITRLAQAATFEEAAQIALAVLGRLARLGDVVQIRGPMSTGGLGTVEANMARFRRAVDAAIGRGLNVFDQLVFQDAIVRISKWTPEAEYCHDILSDFYQPIFESGHVRRTLFLSGWEASTGATWERRQVERLSIVHAPYPEEWLS